MHRFEYKTLDSNLKWTLFTMTTYQKKCHACFIKFSVWLFLVLFPLILFSFKTEKESISKEYFEKENVQHNTRIIYKLFKEDNNLGTLVGRGHLKWEIDLKFTFVLHGYTEQWVEIISERSIAPVFSRDIYVTH